MFSTRSQTIVTPHLNIGKPRPNIKQGKNNTAEKPNNSNEPISAGPAKIKNRNPVNFIKPHVSLRVNFKIPQINENTKNIINNVNISFAPL